jgi:hypothetical protein
LKQAKHDGAVDAPIIVAAPDENKAKKAKSVAKGKK